MAIARSTGNPATDKCGQCLRRTATGLSERSRKIRIRLENSFLPGDLEARIEAFVANDQDQRYHEALCTMTPADAIFGRAAICARYSDDRPSVRPFRPGSRNGRHAGWIAGKGWPAGERSDI